MAAILITGGTGFLGKHLGLKLKEEGHEVILAGRNNKQILAAAQFTGCKAFPLDVCRIESVRDLFVQTKPDIVIHAAATKLIDFAETQPMEVVDVNVLGSQNVARVAIEQGSKLVVGISTDKASPPVRNTYGLTKALMERLFCAMDGKTATRFLCVRYGNVAWATGSVFCTWKKMLEEKGMIETTGPKMIRFFFLIDEAVDLILTAIKNARVLHGKVLTRYMKAAKMEDILKIWTREKGGKYKKAKERPGERNEEYLVGELEQPYTTIKKYNGILHYVISFNEKSKKPLAKIVSSGNTQRLSAAEIKRLIKNHPGDKP